MSESEADTERSRKMTETLSPRQPVDGIGPTTTDGMPIVLRSVSNFLIEKLHFKCNH